MSTGRRATHAGKVLRTLPAWVLLGCLACAVPHPQAFTSPVPEPARRRARVVSVVPLPPDTAPQPELGGRIGKARGTGRGAAQGAGVGALVGLEVCLEAGPLGAVLAPFVIPATTLAGGAGGAAFGYADAIPEKEARAVQAALARERRDLSAELARRVAGRLPGLGRIEADPGHPPDLRLEVGVTAWGLYGGVGSHPVADVRLVVKYWVQDAEGGILATREFVTGGPRRPFQEWAEGDGARLREAVESDLGSAAEAITDAAFLIQDFDVPKLPPTPLCGLAPRDPGPVTMPAFAIPGRTPEVASLTPLLRWEAFPRSRDRLRDEGGQVQRVTAVRYDLRIWTSVRGGPGDLVYERLNLPLVPREASTGPLQEASEGGAVEHRVETPLRPDTEYLWSVRARFSFDGEPRATRWSLNQDPDARALPATQRWFAPPHGARGPCLYDGIPPLRHHRFRTPQG